MKQSSFKIPPGCKANTVWADSFKKATFHHEVHFKCGPFLFLGSWLMGQRHRLLLKNINKGNFAEYLTSSVHQPPASVSAAVRLADDGHQLPFGQVQVQVSAAHHGRHHLVDLSRAVFVRQLLQTPLRRRAQRLTEKRRDGRDCGTLTSYLLQSIPCVSFNKILWSNRDLINLIPRLLRGFKNMQRQTRPDKKRTHSSPSNISALFVPTWTAGALSVSSTLRHRVSSLRAPSSTADSAHLQNAVRSRGLWGSWRSADTQKRRK